MLKYLKIRSAARLALTVGFICASLVWLGVGLQIVPNPFQSRINGRISVTKSIAAGVTSFAEDQRLIQMQTVLDRVVMSDDDILSAGVRRLNNYIVKSGPHTEIWDMTLDREKSTDSQIVVKIMTNGRHWGDLELKFEPLFVTGAAALLEFPFPMVAFLTCSLSLATWYVLSKTFKYLNPSNVVPGRVRSAFDTLAEGLILIDKSGEVAHANEAFCRIMGMETGTIVGMDVNDLDWGLDSKVAVESFPWNQCLLHKEPVCGEVIEINAVGRLQKYIVNATPITSEKGESRGVLVSFDDVTDLERKKAELAKAVDTLRRSRDEIERQNEQLNFLANYDPMTKCMNRRSFWVQYEQLWNGTEPEQLSIMMVDVDHFKSINDTYGHSVGDEVLVGVGDLLKDVVGDRGHVCRYGGEEFVVLFAGRSFDSSVGIAEDVGQEFRDRKLAELDVTVSIGVSNKSLKAMDPQHMLDQADQCLYAAKRNGRDQVVRFDECPSEGDMASVGDEIVEEVEESGTIQYSSVTGLLSALSFRSQDTAEHSLRVSDLAVAVGGEMLSRRQLYTLEVSALLHDIGKIGVPDAILNKPGPLSRDEWAVMSKHDEIGVEIVRSAFASDEIADIIASHHYCFTMRKESQTLFQEEIPLCARIITVCDAFDAMVSDRVYRKGMSLQDAFAELRRCAPQQFDGSIVERLIEFVEINGYSPECGVVIGTSSRSVAAIGKHIESLCNAIESEDVELLKTVVEDLKVDAVENQVTPIADAALRLNDAIVADSDLLQVIELADEVMGMCRSTRGVLVESAERTVNPSEDAKE